MDVHGGIATQPLRRVLDDEMRALNPVIGDDFFPGSAVVGPLQANQVSPMSALSSAMRAAAALS